MKSSGVLFWLVVLFLFSGTATGVLLYRMVTSMQDSGSETVYEEDGAPSIANSEMTEFTLTERSGEEFHSEDMEGEVWVVSFFFATCPQECPQMNRKIQELQREFGDEGVKFVSITCDPARDTPAALREYADRFNAQPGEWFFLTGDLEYIGRIGQEMFRVQAIDHRMQPVHTNKLTVVDRAGNLHYFSWMEPENFANMKAQLREFVAQTPEEARQAALEEEVEDEDAAVEEATAEEETAATEESSADTGDEPSEGEETAEESAEDTTESEAVEEDSSETTSPEQEEPAAEPAAA